MKLRSSLHPVLLLGAGAAFGVLLTLTGITLASSPEVVPSAKQYIVSIDEVRQNFVFGEPVSGAYTHTVTLSDGRTHEVTLRPVKRKGIELVELTDKTKDGTGLTYMGPNGTTTNGHLMVGVKSKDDMQAFIERSTKAGLR
jgi:hypothetical protein